jgi:glycerol-3-phosphate dehydrogenase
VAQPDYDVVVVGGGINGVGVAQAAAAAGHRVMLLEKSGLAAGTSSKSSKLIHGGLRYLESYEFGLVRESLYERALLLKLAPDIVQLKEFYVPLYKTTRRGPILLRAGLSLYWLLSGLNRQAVFSSVPRHQWDRLDGLRTDNLRSVFSYQDGCTDDALLTRAVMQSAIELGAELHSPAQFWGADMHSTGCQVHYRQADKEKSCSARVLINAAGPWVNEVARLIQPEIPRLPIQLVQGTHIEVPGEMGSQFYYLESPRDGRAVFVMPRAGETQKDGSNKGRLIVGTTETRFRGYPDDVRPHKAEENYLLGVLQHYFPEYAGMRRSDLLTSWAGLRVLPGGDGHVFHRSRETILHRDRETRPRMLTVYGGKLTSYRATAEKVLEHIAPSLPAKKPLASTRKLTLRPA